MKIKRLISCIIFPIITIFLIIQVSAILDPKPSNRYYILENDPNQKEDYDLQIFGSCHSYTSFNPVKFKEETGIASYVYGNPGEIIPTTYLHMIKQFKKHAPKVALVEIWGMNPYETYDSTKKIFSDYFLSNVERLPLTKEKIEMIDYFSDNKYVPDAFNNIEANFSVFRYKDRLIDGSLSEIDFNYSFDLVDQIYVVQEMSSRLANYGFKENMSNAIEDYPELQVYIEDGELVEIEPDIVKYIEKIIKLCKDYNVELIFYRSPYISSENELKKVNHLQKICDENGLLFIDLEKEIEYDYTVDFVDYQHLSVTGANKSTVYLKDAILKAMNK